MTKMNKPEVEGESDWSEADRQIREYEEMYPELACPPYTGDEVVRVPIFIYDIRSV